MYVITWYFGIHAEEKKSLLINRKDCVTKPTEKETKTNEAGLKQLRFLWRKKEIVKIFLLLLDNLAFTGV